MIYPLKLKWLFLCTVLFLGACSADAIITYHLDPPGNKGVRYFNSATNDGVVRMDISGNPFDVSQSSLEALVTSEFAGAYIGHQAQFSTTAPPELDSNTRIVIYFQPGKEINRSTICNPEYLFRPSSGNSLDTRLEILASICVGKSSHSFTKVKGPMPKALNSPEMIYFIKTMARSVIPEIKNENDNNCTFPTC